MTIVLDKENRFITNPIINEHKKQTIWLPNHKLGLDRSIPIEFYLESDIDVL